MSGNFGERQKGWLVLQHFGVLAKTLFVTTKLRVFLCAWSEIVLRRNLQPIASPTGEQYHFVPIISLMDIFSTFGSDRLSRCPQKCT